MGSPGPIPKRSDERRRRNRPDVPVDSVPASGAVAVPLADPEWKPLARALYDSLAESAQRRFWEPSDWQAARAACDLYSRELGKSRPCAPILKLAFDLLGGLGLTEGDRRRMRIEIERNKRPTSVSILDEYRDKLGG